MTTAQTTLTVLPYREATLCTFGFCKVLIYKVYFLCLLVTGIYTHYLSIYAATRWDKSPKCINGCIDCWSVYTSFLPRVQSFKIRDKGIASWSWVHAYSYVLAAESYLQSRSFQKKKNPAWHKCRCICSQGLIVSFGQLWNISWYFSGESDGNFMQAFSELLTTRAAEDQGEK